ncbi:alpha/beta hydrolase [Polaribacter sp. MSW13]|uniref:Alpha/beta hydrolase n=1 Tax=Polaribacter marinus TaxID=2916838 RepID=A0A9X2AKH2_9FLAO|nr:alpha/beta hydrolase [Polaribacter marinus]MCI2229513.1 alpha/beta hydrolase [Polaribacter marinus]
MQHFITFKNTQISYSDVGKGTAIVLLHGFLENSTMWADIVPEISKRNRVITIDLLGHGKSDCLGYVHSMELFAEAVENVLKHLRIRKCLLVGHSLGGYVALAFAEKHPQKIKGLCLMNSTSSEDSDERKELRTRANKMVQNNFNAMVKMSISNLFHQENLFIYKKEIEAIKEEALKTSLQGYIAGQEGMKIRPNRSCVLTENKFKKLMIIGKKDPILDFEMTLLEAKKTGSEFVVFPDGHMSHIENKLEFISVLKKFIKL